MDGTTNRSGSSGEHIWLRYATQFSQDGRTYTIEMGIPVPLGASAEARAQLIQEAQAGMDQLASHVEKRVAQSLKRGSQNVVATGPTVSPPPSPRPVPTPVTAPAQRPAALPAPQTAPQPSSTASVVAGLNTAREVMQERASTISEPLVIPPTRPSLSASMPQATGGNDLKLPQFIQQIRDELNLNPQEAMKILKVKSLSTGINLRDALEQLRREVASGSNEATRAERRDETSGTGAQGGVGGRGAPEYTQQKTQSESEDRFDRENTQDDIAAANTTPLPPMRPSAPTPIQLHNVLRGSSDEGVRESARTVNDGRPIYIFDEEDEEEPGEEDGLKEDELLEDLDEPLTLSTQDRVRGRTLINRLRESRGSTAANSGRLNALNNVAISQVGEEQFQELIEGIWGVTAIKKLKVDQVEALISWAKEDDFVSDADAVLLLLEEERYARGNR